MQFFFQFFLFMWRERLCFHVLHYYNVPHVLFSQTELIVAAILIEVIGWSVCWILFTEDLSRVSTFQNPSKGMLGPSRSNEYSGQPCQYQLKTSLQSVCRQDLVQDYLSQCPQAVRTCWFGKKKVNKKGKSNMKKTLRKEKKKKKKQKG